MRISEESYSKIKEEIRLLQKIDIILADEIEYEKYEELMNEYNRIAMIIINRLFDGVYADYRNKNEEEQEEEEGDENERSI